MKKIICVIVFYNLCNLCFSQESFNSADVEKKTYQMYLEKKWNSLAQYGNKAIENGTDYYYLRVRIGIAHYEMQEYRLAQKHFLKALEFNSSDDVAMEYLYYSYLYSGHYDEAQKLTKKFSKDLTKKLKINDLSSVNFLFAEGGTKQSSSDLFSPPRYVQLGLGHQLGKSASVIHAFTNYYQPLNNPPNNGIFTQNQYYLKSNIAIGNTWLLSPATHLLFRKFEPNQQNQPLHPPPGKPMPRPPQTVYENSALLSVALKKSLPYFDAKISSSVFKQRISSVFQESASLTLFPFANNRLSLAATSYVVEDKNVNRNFYATSYTFGFRPTAKIGLSVNYLKNQSIFLNEENGYVVNNSFDLTSSRYSVSADFFLSKHLSLYLLLMKENKIETQQKINYYYNSVIAGLKIVP